MSALSFECVAVDHAGAGGEAFGVTLHFFLWCFRLNRVLKADKDVVVA